MMALRSSQKATFTGTSFLFFFYPNEEERRPAGTQRRQGGEKTLSKGQTPASLKNRTTPIRGRYSDIVSLAIVISSRLQDAWSERESVHDSFLSLRVVRQIHFLNRSRDPCRVFSSYCVNARVAVKLQIKVIDIKVHRYN